MMLYLHFVAAILATWRLTELFTQDRITQGLRTKFPTYLWQCPRCMSVWAGGWCTLMLALGPPTHWWSCWIGLWPSTFSWLYFTHNDWLVARKLDKTGRRFELEVRGAQWTVTRNDLTADEFRQFVMHQLATQVQPPQHTNGSATVS